MDPNIFRPSRDFLGQNLCLRLYNKHITYFRTSTKCLVDFLPLVIVWDVFTVVRDEGRD